MFCVKCGASLPDEANFCLRCGSKVNGVSESTVRFGKYYTDKIKKEPLEWIVLAKENDRMLLITR